jgi:DNA-binding transcriptional ArsR family regulator
MPQRALVARELAELLGILAHPQRIRIVEELALGERHVNALQQLLGISHSGVSQHLAVLRAHRLVAERREGRHVVYHLRNPELAAWLTAAMTFLEDEQQIAQDVRAAIAKVRKLWAPRRNAT